MGGEAVISDNGAWGVKVGIIRNPVSGGRSARKSWLRARAELESCFGAIEEHETIAGQTARIASGLCDRGFDLIIAVGGDGTIGDVVDGILSSSRPQTSFSFIPSGTGCDFARNFNLPKDPRELVRTIASAPVRQIDSGWLRCEADNGDVIERHFANIASLGVSGNIVRSVNRARRGGVLPGPLRFLIHSVREILRYRPPSVRLIIDGEEVFSGPVTVIAVANGGWFGGGMHVAPSADLADGLFDVAVLGGARTLGVLGLLRKIYSAGHVGDPLVSFHQARTVEVLSVGEGSALIDADGEAPGRIAARFEIRPAALHLKI